MKMDYILYLVCFLVLWVVARFFLSLLFRCHRNLPPGPIPLPVIGNLVSLGDKPHLSLTHLSQTYGPVIFLQLGSLKTVVVSSSASANEVMQKHDVSFSCRTVPDVLRACRHSDFSMVWLPSNPDWRNLKKIANTQVFSSRMLDARSHLRKLKVDELLSQVDACCRAGVAVDIGQAAFNTTLNLMSNTFFSVDLADQQLGLGSRTGLKELVWQIMLEVGKPNLSDYFPLLKWLDPQGIRGRTEVHFRKILDLFDGLIVERLEAARESSDDSSPADTLDVLLKLINEDCEGFNRDHLRHLLLDLFVAGTDTTSSTLEWAMAELLCNPIEMKKVQDELQNVIGKENPVEEGDISKLSYLQAVIKETFRLHPAIPLLVPRKAITDVTLCGFTVPKDSQLLVNAWAIGRDSTLWEDANSFKPQRFMGSQMDVKGQNFELIPFGAGRRICPGMPLVIRMLPIMLASLVHSFDWKLEDGNTRQSMDMEEKFGITLQKAQPLLVVPINKL